MGWDEWAMVDFAGCGGEKEAQRMLIQMSLFLFFSFCCLKNDRLLEVSQERTRMG